MPSDTMPDTLADPATITPADRAKAVAKAVRDDELFDVPSDARWEREIEIAIKAEAADKIPIADFLELYDAALAVMDQFRLHANHAEYTGGMNAVSSFREIAAQLRWKHADKMPDPLTELLRKGQGHV